MNYAAYYLGTHARDLSMHDLLIIFIAIFCAMLITSGVLPALFKFLWYSVVYSYHGFFEKNPLDELEKHKAYLVKHHKNLGEQRKKIQSLPHPKAKEMGSKLEELEMAMQAKINQLNTIRDDYNNIV